MPRKPATAPEPAATRAQRPKAKSAIPKPAVRTLAKAATKPAARPAAKATKAATAKGGIKAAVKSAARALANPPARKAVAKPGGKVVERAPVLDARPVLVRDSFTMPEQEYAVLLEVKQACLRAGIDVKKSELLRIGVALLGQLDVATLQGVLAALPQLKTGRPPAQE
ncbi:hypothetical protein SOM61_18885 [Massilia sp. CFBP9012]|uniref:hypothetical protein n=1 Tax=Massilia sp. CFBP9012 TaxID=3096531 RepID=UPI002A6ADB2B|nr:hypothetical protein [Massilia sp. CFBP9012]MDY0977035.1 hypothetical protein [Massilia sp. CFBP9012]